MREVHSLCPTAHEQTNSYLGRAITAFSKLEGNDIRYPETFKGFMIKESLGLDDDRRAVILSIAVPCCGFNPRLT